MSNLPDTQLPQYIERAQQIMMQKNDSSWCTESKELFAQCCLQNNIPPNKALTSPTCQPNLNATFDCLATKLDESFSVIADMHCVAQKDAFRSCLDRNNGDGSRCELERIRLNGCSSYYYLQSTDKK